MLTGYDLMHQTNALRLLGAESLARQGVAAQLSHRDGIAQLRDDDGSRQSPAHLRDREQGIVGGDHDIAGGNDASAAAEAAALEATVGTGRRLSRSMAWAVARLTRMFSCAEALATDR